MIGEVTPTRMDLEAFQTLARGRRSARAYGDRTVTIEEIEQLIDIARWAPSPSNRQPWKFLAITSRDLLARLRAEVAVGCQHLLAKQVGPDARMVEDYLRNFVHFADAPVVLALMVRRTHNRLADHVSELESDSALLAVGAAMQNILLAAEAHGMVACPMSGPLIAKPGIEAELGVEAPWSLVALVPVGWPGSEPAPLAPERKPLNLIWKHIP